MRHKLRAGALLLLLFFLLSGCLSPEPSGTPEATSSGPLFLHFIDVGQGDAALLEFPDGERMLIDAGEDERALDYLCALQIDRIDYLIATHPHSDHIGGMAEIIDAFSIGAIYMPRTGHTTKTYQRLLETIDSHGLSITEAKAGVTFKGSTFTAEFLSPVSVTGDLNNDSAVLKLTYGSNVFLFMGDAEKQAEQAISAPVKSDLLKVGHHGSSTSTSSAFLERVSPTYAVISCGANNQYGHPSSAVLERLDSIGAQIFRTDLSGTIRFRSDGQKITPLSSTARQNAPSLTRTSVTTVYITETGTKYHRTDCRYLKNSRIPIPISELSSKYTPCNVCRPAA